MNRTTTNLSVCSRAILRCTHPNAKCIIARYYRNILSNFMEPNRLLRENLEDFKKPLESRRDGISVEKRNLIHLSPVGGF